jgi:hypothetical protein
MEYQIPQYFPVCKPRSLQKGKDMLFFKVTKKKSYEIKHSVIASIPMPSGNCSNNQSVIQPKQILQDMRR